uniref:GTPase IMAP family member 8 n=1 Tax=Hucho hucho TaxID=62062 RepID=A0A4W5JW06_9TELE
MLPFGINTVVCFPIPETVSWNSDWNVFWKLLCVGILFVIPLAFYLSSWRSNSEQVYWQTVSAFRLVLIGNTGQGRSSAGNTILGREAFRVDFSLGAVTTECQSWTGPVAATGPTGWAHRNHVTVVDTPGVSTTMALGHHRAATAECVNLAAPGPHAFLLVIRLGVRFTEEERNAIVSWIQENFGEESLMYTMVLFTWGDQLEGKPVEDLLKDNSQLLQLISTCRGRYHVFNNKEKGDHTQVTELLEKIEEMVESNGGNRFNVNTHPVREKEGSGVVVTVVMLVAVGAVFKLIVDDLWSKIQDGGNRQ